MRAAVAAASLPVGEADGVRIVREEGALVVIFTPRADKLRRRIHTGDRTRGMDYCRLWLAARTVSRDGERRRIRRELLVSVPLTQAGAVYLDEQGKAITLVGVLGLAGAVAEERGLSGYPTPAQLLEATGRFGVPPSGRPLAVLAAPSDTPPGNAVGYYSDGAQHVAAVILSASSRRPFVEQEGDVLHTNVARFMYGDLD